MTKFVIDDFTQHLKVEWVGLAALVFLSLKGFAKNLLVRDHAGTIPDRPEPEHPKLIDVLFHSIAVVYQQIGNYRD